MSKNEYNYRKKYLITLGVIGLGVCLFVVFLFKMLFTYNYRISSRPNSFVSNEQNIKCENMGIYYSCDIIYYNTYGEGIDECTIHENHIQRPEVKSARVFYNTKKDCSLKQKDYIERVNEIKTGDGFNYALIEAFMGFGIVILLCLMAHMYFEMKR